ncbi:hypothetical protein [Paludisphaera rhizosphaerae]|uniref:hypothetical protein n=1 Tax=Paludisphaera rhizosphaerae TaxID=2711216 RepID=UPI0013E9F2FF|nr:hypothetical protein [Paludisphaera rhizosphaerae]
MGSTYRFLAIGDEVNAVSDWFLGQPNPPEVIDEPSGQLLYFRGMGPLAQMPDGSGIDVRRSPLVSLFRPVLRRGVLWTTGEVHFLPMPLRRNCPPLYALSLQFKKWLSSFDLVFTNEPSWPGEWNYYLEGSIKNFDPPVLALPRAAQALRKGQYFVDLSDNDYILDKLCRSLRHRGVECILDAESDCAERGIPKV